ncbi:polyhydroxyalkanoic acid system family protein [Dokdonella sp.]|uniref:polyhydroxyalkanoic acid system family protein n=1 Tax=Dokdonella sp. TaxID=2291710 RepID=UPI0025BA8A9D|nr:polyhydroxyalkanoic acid system family protein [Dokdonella sp.]MBX3688177.1 polyhydroxyalkanoic acid system family protein [Dokdonella sp.]
MAVIDIKRTHGGTLKSTKTAVTRVAKSLGKEYGVDYAWEGHELHFERSGVRGAISITTTTLHVRAELGFLMSAMKGAIEREIERLLDEHLD